MNRSFKCGRSLLLLLNLHCCINAAGGASSAAASSAAVNKKTVGAKHAAASPAQPQSAAAATAAAIPVRPSVTVVIHQSGATSPIINPADSPPSIQGPFPSVPVANDPFNESNDSKRGAAGRRKSMPDVAVASAAESAASMSYSASSKSQQVSLSQSCFKQRDAFVKASSAGTSGSAGSTPAGSVPGTKPPSPARHKPPVAGIPLSESTGEDVI
jgi:hypothetical protein